MVTAPLAAPTAGSPAVNWTPIDKVAEPLPAAGLTVSHGWFEAAVHVTTPAAPPCVTRTTCGGVRDAKAAPVVAAPKFSAPRSVVITGPGWPAWVTAWAWPAIISVALRAAMPGFAAAVPPTAPLPEPAAGARVTNDDVVEAVHAHPGPAVTPTVNEPPAARTLVLAPLSA